MTRVWSLRHRSLVLTAGGQPCTAPKFRTRSAPRGLPTITLYRVLPRLSVATINRRPR